MLQRLELADRLSKLHALLEVGVRDLEHRFHRAQRLGHLREDGSIDGFFEYVERSAPARRAAPSAGTTHRLEFDIGSVRPVDQRIRSSASRPQHSSAR